MRDDWPDIPWPAMRFGISSTRFSPSDVEAGGAALLQCWLAAIAGGHDQAVAAPYEFNQGSIGSMRVYR